MPLGNGTICRSACLPIASFTNAACQWIVLNCLLCTAYYVQRTDYYTWQFTDLQWKAHLVPHAPQVQLLACLPHFNCACRHAYPVACSLCMSFFPFLLRPHASSHDCMRSSGFDSISKTSLQQLLQTLFFSALFCASSVIALNVVFCSVLTSIALA